MPDRALACIFWSEIYKMEAEHLEWCASREAERSATRGVARFFPDEAKTIDNVQDEIAWLREKAAVEIDTIEAYGGVEAARAAYGKFGRVAYAGEIPPRPDEQVVSRHPNYPA